VLRKELRRELVAAKLAGTRSLDDGYTFRTNEAAADVALRVFAAWLLVGESDWLADKLDGDSTPEETTAVTGKIGTERPRVWDRPVAPPDVSRVRDRHGRVWKRVDGKPDSWAAVYGMSYTVTDWFGLLTTGGMPLTEVTP
jgi:hypothetical protein